MRNQRKVHGESLREIAKRINISAAFLSDLELGKRNWTQARVDQFLKALPVPKRRKRPSGSKRKQKA